MGDQLDEAKGRTKEAAGALTGDDDLKREGKLDRVGSDIKKGAERSREKIDRAVDKVKEKL